MHLDATTHANTMQLALRLPKRYLALLWHHFTIPAHADVTTRANTMQLALRLPKTLPDTTFLPFHHTSDHRRHHSCKYHATCPSPTQNATSRHFAACSPYQRPPTQPVMPIPCNTPFAHPKRYLTPLHHYFTIPAHHRRHDSCQYHATCPSPTQNAT